MAVTKFDPNVILKNFSEKDYNILYPSQQAIDISPLQKVVIETVKISSDENDGEVFKVGAEKDGDKWVNKYALSKTALEKISYTAGIIIDPNNSGRVDDKKNPRLVEFQVTGAIKKPDGTFVTVTKTKAVDLDAIEAETRATYEELARDGKIKGKKGGNEVVLKLGTAECTEEINFRVRKKMIQVDKFKVSLAETGAYTRVIRSLLALKPAYRKTELDKPFVIPHIVTNVEYLLADPEIKRMMVERAVESSMNVFGTGGGLGQRRSLPESKEIEVTNAEVVEQTIIGVDDGIQDDEKIIETQPSPVVNTKVTEDDYKKSWLSSKPAERMEELEKILEKKGEKFPDMVGGKPLKFMELAAERQVNAMWYYFNLPDKPLDVPLLPWEKQK